MLNTPHLFAGAAIVKLIPNPIISFPLAYLSHFLLDFTPHWDGSPRPPFGKMFFVLVALDYLFGVFLIWWFVQTSPEKFLVLFGAFLGTAPDFLLGSYRNFPKLPWNKIPLYIKMNDWHRSIQHNIPPLGGLATGVLVVLISAWILINF